jgi:mannose-6-phosphate isomerase-like protein (cupin superfamily)
MIKQCLSGLSVSDTSGPIQTFDQLGGMGSVLNKALAIPVHLGHPWSSIEYVVVPPVTDGVTSSVGEHVQLTDELYYIHRGAGVLTTNGAGAAVAPGFLALAPRGTRHSIRNESDREELAFLVIELVPPCEGAACQARELPCLPALLEESEAFHPAAIGARDIRLRVAAVDLSQHFSAAWGRLALVEVPPGGHMYEYCEQWHDENLFVLAGNATVIVAEQRFHSWEYGLNVLVPRGVPRTIVNRSSVEPLLFLSTLACRAEERSAQP